MNIAELKIHICKVKIHIKWGPINVEEPEYITSGNTGVREFPTEDESGRGCGYKMGKLLEVDPETPKVVRVIPVEIPERIKREIESGLITHEVTANHKFILSSLNSKISTYNRAQESRALQDLPFGEHTITFKYLRK